MPTGAAAADGGVLFPRRPVPDGDFAAAARALRSPLDYPRAKAMLAQAVGVRTDTPRVQRALEARGDVRPHMVYATMTDRPPPPGSPLRLVLRLLAQRHTTLGVLCGTYADGSMDAAPEGVRPLPVDDTGDGSDGGDSGNHGGNHGGDGSIKAGSPVLQVDVRDTTWGAGRNRLLRVAQRMHPDFEYIVLADDDVDQPALLPRGARRCGLRRVSQEEGQRARQRGPAPARRPAGAAAVPHGL